MDMLICRNDLVNPAMSTSYPKRERLCLDGAWNFHFEEGAPLESADPAFDAYDDIMPVPASFDATPRYRMKRGLALHRRVVRLEEDWENGLLRIGACGLRGRAWIDCREAGFVPMGWNGFAFETGPLARGAHVIVIAADNRIDATASPFFHPNYDFYGWGGLYRPVSLERIPAGFSLDRVQVRTSDLEARCVQLRLLFRGDAPDGPLPATIAFDTDASPREATLDVRQGEAVLELPVPGGRLWSFDAPHLHTVRVETAGEAVEETFGIRIFEARDGAFWLNGRRVRLLGFNRHESHPETGPATSVAMMMEDLHHLKSLGCNFIRGAHYPQDPRFLDLCDRIGMLVWEEALGWGDCGERLSNPVFCDGQEAQVRRMVRASVNHPSVVIWGFLNECDSSSDEGVALVRRLVEACHEEDPSRPATFACMYGARDRAVPFCDIAAYNTYPGWIGPDCQEEPEARIPENRAALVAHFRAATKPGTPIMISEMGTCGIYGAHDEAAAQWTEEFQARYVEAFVRDFLDCSDLAGLSIWHFVDAVSFHRMGGCIRAKPFAQNLAGAYDAYRRPKLVASVVSRLFHGAADAKA